MAEENAGIEGKRGKKHNFGRNGRKETLLAVTGMSKCLDKCMQEGYFIV